MRALVLPSWYPTPDNPVKGGFFHDQARAVQKSGVDVTVLFVEPRSLGRFGIGALRESHFQTTEATEGRIPVVRVHGWNPLAQTVPGGRVWARLMAGAVGRFIERHGRPDVVHAQASLWAGEAARLVERRHGIPYLVTEHSSAFAEGTLPPSALRQATKIFGAAGATLAVSAALRERMLERGVGGPIETVPNLIDTEFWSPPPEPRRPTPFTFFALGLLIPRKRFDLLLAAFAERFRGTGARLVIGGEGPERPRLEALVKTLGLGAQVELPGALDREAARRAMWSANGFVLSSAAETFGVVVIEAMATGLPVVVTRCGGPEEVVTPETGCIVLPDDQRGLGEAMVAMTQGAPPIDPLGSHRLVAERYGERVVGARLAAIYGRVAGGAR